MRSPRMRAAMTAVVVAAAATSLTLAPQALAHAAGHRGSSGSCPARVFAVTHFELATGYGDVAPAGPSAGDTHSFDGPVYRPGSRTAVVGSVMGTGITVATNTPVAGEELRTVSLAFALPDLGNQIAIGGVAAYPTTSATLGNSTVTVRPITGGTGRYAGARGWLRTTHFAIGHWRQEFHLCRTAP